MRSDGEPSSRNSRHQRRARARPGAERPLHQRILERQSKRRALTIGADAHDASACAGVWSRRGIAREPCRQGLQLPRASSARRQSGAPASSSAAYDNLGECFRLVPHAASPHCWRAWLSGVCSRRVAHALAHARRAPVAHAHATAPASSYRFGLSDYEPSTFSDPRVGELGVHLARDVVPWNVALDKRDLAQVTAWLDAVKHAYHIIPLITFQHADNNDPAPSPAQFLKAFLRVPQAVPLGERVRPLGRGHPRDAAHRPPPWLAAEYYNALAANCRGCEITAPDILDSDGNVEAWVGSVPRTRPPISEDLALQPLQQRQHRQSRADRKLPRGDARAGVVQRDRRSRVVALQRQADRPRRSVSRRRVAENIFRLAKLSPRITRIYYYHWRSPGHSEGQGGQEGDLGCRAHEGQRRGAPGAVRGGRELHRSIQRSIPKIF